jgi:hypothetical protein
LLAIRTRRESYLDFSTPRFPTARQEAQVLDDALRVLAWITLKQLEAIELSVGDDRAVIIETGETFAVIERRQLRWSAPQPRRHCSGSSARDSSRPTQRAVGSGDTLSCFSAVRPGQRRADVTFRMLGRKVLAPIRNPDGWVGWEVGGALVGHVGIRLASLAKCFYLGGQLFLESHERRGLLLRRRCATPIAHGHFRAVADSSTGSWIVAARDLVSEQGKSPQEPGEDPGCSVVAIHGDPVACRWENPLADHRHVLHAESRSCWTRSALVGHSMRLAFLVRS